MTPKTKFESVQKKDASEFIPGVEWLGLKDEWRYSIYDEKKPKIFEEEWKNENPWFKKSEMHGGLPNMGTVVSASERRGGALYKHPNK
jgi:hypothetical protein